MTTPSNALSRRRLLLALSSSVALSACGGGDSNPAPAPVPAPPPGSPPPAPPAPPPPGPQIQRFEATPTAAFVGDAVELRGEFTGGVGRIDPTLGPVTSGAIVSSGPLDRDSSFRLVVSAPGAQDVEREVAVSVTFRDRYTALPSPFAASGHAAVATADGTVLLIGGSRDGAALPSSIERYDPRTQGLSSVGQLLFARAAPVATRLSEGVVLITGGSIDPAGADRAELVDERTATSTPAGRLSVARSDHAAVPLGGGRVLVTGGVTLGEDHGFGISASAEIWEPATRSFRRLATRMHTARAQHTMTMLGGGRILIVGGQTTSADPALGEIFDPVTEQFTPVYSALPLRAQHAALPAPDGGVLVLGGEILAEGAEAPVATASVLRFDPVLGLFEELPPLARARSAVRAALLPGGQVLLFGGRDAAPTALPHAERYAPATGGQPIRPLPVGRSLHTVTRLASGRILVAGGETSGGEFVSAVEIYD
jgi:hypothetical protein